MNISKFSLGDQICRTKPCVALHNGEDSVIECFDVFTFCGVCNDIAYISKNEEFYFVDASFFGDSWEIFNEESLPEYENDLGDIYEDDNIKEDLLTNEIHTLIDEENYEKLNKIKRILDFAIKNS